MKPHCRSSGNAGISTQTSLSNVCISPNTPLGMHAVIGAENPTGVPAKVIRGLSDEEIAWKVEGTHTYQDLTRHSLAIMSQFIPLGLGVKGPGTGRILRLLESTAAVDGGIRAFFCSCE